MKKNLTEVVFILDRSGSMSGLESDTIGGFNSMLEKQKKEKGDALVSAVLFDTSFERLYDRENIKTVKKMTAKDYSVGGCTALLDALGDSINHIANIHKELGDEAPEKTIFIITTDGLENSSTEYSHEAIKKLVSKMQKKNKWEFLFLGANIDAIDAAGNIGIRADRAVNYKCDKKGTSLNFDVLSKAVSNFRSCEVGCADAALANWDEEIVEDIKKRG